MKRTTERADLVQKQLPEYISGCRQFEGEDLNYRTRINTNNQMQKEWIKEQQRELSYHQQRERQEESEYATQTENVTRMRGMMEDDATVRKQQQLQEMKEYNQRLAQEKKDRENAWKNDQQDKNAFEISRTNMSDIMTENFQTTKSQLAPHRFVPYHFKGLRSDQIQAIDDTRVQQTKDNKLARKNENTEEYQWAVQNLANTQHYLNNELDLQKRQEQMMAAHRDQHLADKTAKDARWPNMYGDLNPLPDVKKDMVQGASDRPVNPNVY